MTSDVAVMPVPRFEWERIVIDHLQVPEENPRRSAAGRWSDVMGSGL